MDFLKKKAKNFLGSEKILGVIFGLILLFILFVSFSGIFVKSAGGDSPHSGDLRKLFGSGFASGGIGH